MHCQKAARCTSLVTSSTTHWSVRKILSNLLNHALNERMGCCACEVGEYRKLAIKTSSVIAVGAAHRPSARGYSNELACLAADQRPPRITATHSPVMKYSLRRSTTRGRSIDHQRPVDKVTKMIVSEVLDR